MDPVVPFSLRQKHVVFVPVPTGRHYVMDRYRGEWTEDPSRAEWFYELPEATTLATKCGGHVMPLREAMELDAAA